MSVEPLSRLPIPELLATSIRLMAPAYLRRRLKLVGAPFQHEDTTTFVYVGEADAVRISTFMALFPEIPPLEQVEDTEVWAVTVQLPPTSRVEYKIDVTHQGRSEGIVDPLNPTTALDPFGANSVTQGPAYVEPSWVTGAPLREEAIDLLTVSSECFERPCTTGLYRPPTGEVMADTPLLVIHDASDLVTFADLRTALDGLILGGHVPPFAAVLLDPVHRNREYTASETHSKFVVDEVLPAVWKELEIEGSRRVMMTGASLGAVASLAAAWHNPGVFSDLILLSGSFVTAMGGPWNRGKLFEPVIEFMADFAASDVKPAERIWMACGAYEGLAADNRAFLPVLLEKGGEISYREPADGHHWISWRNSLGEALIDLIGERGDGDAD